MMQKIKQPISEETIYDVSQFFKTLGEPTRLNILLTLFDGEKNVSTITELVGMEQSAVSHQLKLLRLNHLIKSRKEGKTVFYSLDDQHVVDILVSTINHLGHV